LRDKKEKRIESTITGYNNMSKPTDTRVNGCKIIAEYPRGGESPPTRKGTWGRKDAGVLYTKEEGDPRGARLRWQHKERQN